MLISRIKHIGGTYRHMQRYRQILMVLFKYGFGDLISILGLEHYLEIGLKMVSRNRREKHLEVLSRAERLRLAMEELGPTFIKMGQILSTRPDLLPVEFIKELLKLQDKVPPFPFSDVKQIVEKELQNPLDKFFLNFEMQPLAAASIGQVHRAQNLDGKDVAVKVQRPGIRRIIKVDLEIILHLAGLMERYLKGWDIQRPTKIVEEFSRTLEIELDYTREASHIERFTEQFAGDSAVYIPKIYRELTTSRVLTTEFISGIKGSDIDKLEKKGFDRKKIAKSGFDLIMKQIFVHGFFHADPHPGNIFILPGNIICYIDFGMIGRVPLKTREEFAEMVIGVAYRDETSTTDSLLRLTIWESEPDYNLLERDVAGFIDQHCYRPLKEVDLGKLLYQILEMSARHRLIIPQDLFLMIKALGTAEGLGRMLDPDLDVIELAGPFLSRLRLARFNPSRIAQGMVKSGTEFFHLLNDLPGETRGIFRLIKQGKIKMELEHRGLAPMIHAYDRVSNRLAFAIVLASLVIGSALIVLSDVPPKWKEIPVIGLAGFLVAGIMGFWLLISVLRGGRM